MRALLVLLAPAKEPLMSFRRTTFALTCSVCICCGLAILGGQSVESRRLRHQVGARDFSLHPPRALSTTVEPLARPTAAANVVIRVRFDPEERLPSRVSYRGDDDRVLTLADDGMAPDEQAGDSVYAALVRVDLSAMAKATSRHVESRTAQPVSVFALRSKLEHAARLDTNILRPGEKFEWQPWGDPVAVDTERSLLIRHPDVVQDPTRTRAACGQPSMGTWSFGYLMEQMANTPVTGITGSELVRDWLEQWSRDQVVNGWSVPQRDRVITMILDPWIAASGGPGAPLDLSIAPFRLLAIVNRVDLRTNVAYGGGSAGELRFVFVAVRPDCEWMPTFNVILEYGVPIGGCRHLRSWARQWKNLDTIPIGSPAYNAALEAVTEQVVVAGANPSAPNGSAINQVRTNEKVSDPVGTNWEAREFRLSPTHRFAQVTVAQTPASVLNYTTTAVGTFVNARSALIRAGRHTVPLHYPAGVPFRGGASLFGLWSAWGRSGSPAIADREARHQFSLQTCDGCHAGETRTEFTHIKAAAFGETVDLSQFMTGGWVNDTADGSPSRYFNELERRATDLDGLLTTQCALMPLHMPLLSAH